MKSIKKTKDCVKIQMSEIIILGTGVQSRVMAEAIRQSDDTLVGCLTEDETPDGFPYVVLGKMEEANRFALGGRYFILSEENPKKRKALARQFETLNFAAVVHKTALVADCVDIGAGAYIGAGAVIGTETKIGAFTMVGDGVIIGAMSQIGEYCALLSRVNIGRQVVVGQGSYLGLSATLKDAITIAPETVLQTGEIVVKDMVMKMVYKRGAWIYKENGPK